MSEPTTPELDLVPEPEVKPKPRGNYGPLHEREDDGTWGGDPNGWEAE